MERGVAVLKKAQANDPEKTIAYNNLGCVYLRAGEYELAIEQFALAESKIKGDEARRLRRSVYVNWASALSQSNHPREALEKYELALTIGPADPFLLGAAAEIDLRLNQPARAVERLKQSLKLQPRDPNAAYLLARGYLAQQKFVEAAAAFDQAIALNPQNYDAATQRAIVLERLGQPTAAIRLLETTLATASQAEGKNAQVSASRILTQLGTMALSKRDTAGAIERFQQALATWPDNDAAGNNLAWILATSPDEKVRNGSRALELARHVCEELRKRDHSTLGTLAAAYAASGNLPAAVETAQQGLSLPANSVNDKLAIDSLKKQLAAYQQGQLYLEP